jgi:hypothetical protein
MLVFLFLLLLVPLTGHAATIFDDTFTGTGGLSAHTPDVGTSWTSVFSNGLSFTLDGAGAVGDNGPSSSLYNYLTANATYSTADYDVTATFSTFNTAGASRMIGLLARYQDTNNFYLAWIEDGTGTNDVRIYSCVAGTCTKISSTEDTNPTANDVFVLELRGNQIGLKKNGAYVINPITDSSISAAGKAGYGAGDFLNITTASTPGGGGKATQFTVTTVDATSCGRGLLLGVGC